MTDNGTAISAAQHGRRYDIDALRVFAFSLLILYHVGMFYIEPWGWHVKSAYQTDWLEIPMLFTNQWRMSLLFVISGLAMSFVWKKYSPGKLAARRTWRLLLPLLFGMAFIVAPQPYYEALNKGLIEPGFLTFMGQYPTFQDFPGEAWAGEEQIHWTWNHLWYLPYLLFYTLVLIPVGKLVDGPAGFVRQRFRKLRGVWMILMAILGGKGTLWGPIIGAVIFHITQELFWSLFFGWQRVALGAIIVAIVVFFPMGIMGWMRERWPERFGERVDKSRVVEVSEGGGA